METIVHHYCNYVLDPRYVGVYIALSRVKILIGLLLPNILNDDLATFRVSDDLLKEDKRLYGLDKMIQEKIENE